MKWSATLDSKAGPELEAIAKKFGIEPGEAIRLGLTVIRALKNVEEKHGFEIILRRPNDSSREYRYSLSSPTKMFPVGNENLPEEIAVLRPKR